MKKVLLFGIFALLLTVLAGCGDILPEDNRPYIVTTTGMITDITKIVGGSFVRVEGLMGPGVDPHLYKASESDVEKLAKADLILYNGLYLEAKLEDVFKQMNEQGTPTVAVTGSIPKEFLLDSPSYEGQYDPHIWFDVELWKYAVQGARDALMKIDQEHELEYTKRADSYMNRLDDLHKAVIDKADDVPLKLRVLVTAHDAFGYFGQSVRIMKLLDYKVFLLSLKQELKTFKMLLT